MKIVFFGNCQLHALYRVYLQFVVPYTGDTAMHVPIADARRIAEADVLVEQITPMGRPPHADTRARRLFVPVAGAMFLWPFAGTPHPQSRDRYPTYNPFGAELADSWLLRRLREGATPEAAVATYLALDIGRVAHLDRRLEMALETQHRLEADTNYRFAPLIEQHFRTEKLFRIPFHAECRVARHMAETFLAELGAPAAAQANVHAWMTESFMGATELPVHPGVAAHFGLAWADATSRYRFFNEDYLTFEQWALRLCRCEAYPALTEAVNAVLQDQPDAAAKFAAARHLAPASPFVWHAQAVLWLRQKRFAEAAALLRQVIAAAPDLPQTRVHLFECLGAPDDWDEARAVLHAELAARPYQAGLQARMAEHLRRGGRAKAALAAAETAASLAPDRPGFVRLRDALRRAGG